MQKYLIVSHDAGGAEIIAAWVQAHPENIYEYLLEGPAINVFRKKMGEITIHNRSLLLRLEKEAFDVVLTGTSWGVDLEKQAIKASIEQKKFVAVYVDYWKGYTGKLTLEEVLLIPNQVWVGDHYAKRIAQNEFSSGEVIFVENLYLKRMLDYISEHSRKHEREIDRILYVTEPTIDAAIKFYGDPNYFGYTEFSALKAYLEYLSKNQYKVEEFRLRVHPSEHPLKYNELLRDYQNLNIKVIESSEPCLERDIAWANIVVGCETTALAIAALAKKEVYTSVPETRKEIRVPHENIKRIFPINPFLVMEAV